MNSILLQKSFTHYANPSLFNQNGNGLGLTRSKSKLESFSLEDKLVKQYEKVGVGQYDPLFFILWTNNFKFNKKTT